MSVQDIILSSLGIFKIKYSVLDDDLIRYKPGKSKHNERAFHIDLNTIFKVLNGKQDLLKDCKNAKITIASAVLNMVAHYRAYFAKEKYYDTDIYLYYNSPGSDSSAINDVLDESAEIINVIVKYLPKIYFLSNIYTGVDANISMYYFMNKYTDNILMTKNKLLYQLLKKCYILYPSRDDSRIIKSNSITQTFNTKEDYSIDPSLLIGIYSFSGLDKIKGVEKMGIKKSFNLFIKKLNDGSILNDRYSNANDLLDDLGIDNEDTIQIVKSNFKKIDILSKYDNLRKVDKLKLDSCIVDKFAKKELKELNLKYFTGFESLMLQELLMGITDIKQSKNIDW